MSECTPEEPPLIDEREFAKIVVSIDYTVKKTDIDSMGVMYYGMYAHLFDLARLGFYEAFGYPEPSKGNQEGWGMAVIRHSVEIHRAAREGDELTVKAWCQKVRGVRMWMGVQAYAKDSDELVAQGYTVQCFIDTATFRPLKPDPNWRIWMRLREERDKEKEGTGKGGVTSGSAERIPDGNGKGGTT